MTVTQVVEQQLVARLGPISGRASVTFVGTDRIEVLRFTGVDAEGSELTRYATLGMACHPMTDPSAQVADPVGAPRAELVLSLGRPHDDVFRRLAVLAAVPFVEGLVVVPGASLDLGLPLWDGAGFSAVLVAEPGGLVPDLDLDEHLAGEVAGTAPVQFFPLLPMSAHETAWKGANGAAALQERWLAAGTDLRDPDRAAVALL